MQYTVLLKESAEKELETLPSIVHDRIVNVLNGLKHNPRPPGVKKLQGKEGYRIRVGNYRILFTIDDRVALVHVFFDRPSQRSLPLTLD